MKVIKINKIVIEEVDIPSGWRTYMEVKKSIPMVVGSGSEIGVREENLLVYRRKELKIGKGIETFLIRQEDIGTVQKVLKIREIEIEEYILSERDRIKKLSWHKRLFNKF